MDNILSNAYSEKYDQMQQYKTGTLYIFVSYRCIHSPYAIICLLRKTFDADTLPNSNLLLCCRFLVCFASKSNAAQF